MIEVSRKLYMEVDTTPKEPEFDEIAGRIRKVCKKATQVSYGELRCAFYS
jgi:hypothetical protein